MKIFTSGEIPTLQGWSFAIQYIDLNSEIQCDAKMKKLAHLGPHFSQPMGFWDHISQRPSTNPDLQIGISRKIKLIFQYLWFIYGSRTCSEKMACAQTEERLVGVVPLRCNSSDSEEPENETVETINNGSKCSGRLARLCNNAKFSDVVLRVADQRFFAHKLLLANSSDVFE